VSPAGVDVPGELTSAMEGHSYAFEGYLDTETGDGVVLPGDAGDAGAWPDGELERLEGMLEVEAERFEPVPRIS